MISFGRDSRIVWLVATSAMVMALAGCASLPAPAAAHGNVDALREFVANGGDVDIPQRNGQTLLMIGAEAGQAESVYFLLDSGPSFTSRDDQGMTALHYAAGGDHAQIAQALIDRSAPLDSQDNLGATPLHIAAAISAVQVMEVLL